METVKRLMNILKLFLFGSTVCSLKRKALGDFYKSAVRRIVNKRKTNTELLYIKVYV